MNEHDDNADSLTGVWTGLFRHSDGTSVCFTATLIQSGSLLTGSTHEACVVPACPAKTHFANLSGHRDGNRVAFRKSYDPPGFGYDAVAYAGDVNAEATEIAGRWTIDQFWSGDFLMVRDAPKVAAKARRRHATV